MKLQHLAIIFVIIMLPISMVITYYIQTQIDTITFQTQYSSKLQTATHDAIKAFQLNTINNKYSTVSDSKIRDIEASISTFYNSLGTELGASGFNENELKEYIPAIVYTMEDGYYIYSKYYNDTIKDYQFGLRPYIYYSCRYKNGTDDFVVNYSLENFVTIYGVVGGKYVTKSGPLINPDLVTEVTKNENNGEIISLKYDGVLIEKEILKEQLVLLDDLATNSKPVVYEYITYGNKRVYKDDKGYFWNTNGSKQYIQDKATLNFAGKWTIDGHLYSNSAIQYFLEGEEFSKWVNENLSDISQKHAVDASGNQITDFAVNTGDSKIFKLDSTNNPLLDYSVFNENRMSVIRRSIESNLASAIANFGAGADYEFVMPVFTEEDWDKLVNNVSVAAFMQGIPIGAKYYNNYCIITNNKTKEHVSKESIYIITNDNNDSDPLSSINEVHKPSSRDVIDNGKTVIGAYKNVDFEMQTVVLEGSSTECYYHPHANNKCYECMVNVAESYNIDDIIAGIVKTYDLEQETYVESKKIDITNTNLRKVYLTALARERYDLNNIIGDNNDYTEGTEHITKEKIIITLNPNTWTRNIVEATASTTLTGVTLETSKDGITWENKSSQIFESTGTMYARTIDANGNENRATRIITNIDKDPPTKAIVDLNGYVTGEWTTSNVTITASATDTQSGVSYFQYTLDEGKTVFTMPNPYVITWNVQWELFQVRAVDGAENFGDWSDPLKIYRDAKHPDAPNVYYRTGSNTHDWQNNVKIELVPKNNTALKITEYQVDNNNDGSPENNIKIEMSGQNGIFQPANGYSSCNTRFRAVNELGNASQWTEPVHIHIDQDAPSKPTIDLNGYNQEIIMSAVTVEASATDNLSGIAYYEYTTDQNNEFNIHTMPNNPWTIEEEYNDIFYIRAVDGAGNRGLWSDGFKIYIYLQRPSAPTVKYLTNCENTHDWQNDIRIRLTASDEHEVEVTHYQVDYNSDGNPDRTVAVNQIFEPINNDDTCEARFRSVDAEGMASNWTDENITYHIHMDTEPPVFKNPISIVKKTTGVTMYIKATDNRGIKNVEATGWYKNISIYDTYTRTTDQLIWNEQLQAYVYELTLTSKEYDNIIRIKITDIAGNETIVSKEDFEINSLHEHTDECYHKHINSCYKTTKTKDGGDCYCPEHNGSHQGTGHCEWAESEGYDVAWSYKTVKTLTCKIPTDVVQCGYE